MHESVEVLIGVVAGLLTSLLVLLGKNVFSELALPWYRRVTYSGLLVSGSWYAQSSAQKTTLDIRQNANVLSGQASVVSLHPHKDLEIDAVRTFKVTGRVFDRFVVLNLSHVDRSRLGVSTLLLQVSGDGTLMVGATSWYATMLSEIKCGEVTFSRREGVTSKKIA
jgi:hypothetical protein